MTWPDRPTTGVLLSITAFAFLLSIALASPVGAASGVSVAEHDYDGSDLLIEESVTTDGTVTIATDADATEGDAIRITLEDDHPGFAIEAATDETTDDIGISTQTTGDDGIEITITDLGGADTVSGTELVVGVELTATDAVAGRAHEYDDTPIATVTTDETDGDLVGTAAISASVDSSAEIGFNADEIDEEGEDFLPIYQHSRFIIEFDSNQISAKTGDKINLSVDPSIINPDDTDGFGIYDAWKGATLDENITDIEVEQSGDAKVFDGNDDQITITLHTVDDETRAVSNEAIAVWIQITAETDPIKSTADRYRSTDLLTVDVENEDNAELTDNDDIRTTMPVLLDVHPGEPNAEGFDVGLGDGEEFGVNEKEALSIDGLADRHGNTIPRAEFEFRIDHDGGEEVYDGVWTATDGSGMLPIDGTEGPTVPLGRSDVSAEVTDVVGPAEPTENTGSELTETASDVAVYPDDVTVGTAAAYEDFDVDEGAAIEVAIDVGVPDQRIGSVDIELRRESGDGDVAFVDGGSPTATDLWTETEYGGDDHLGSENAWAIERDLGSEDFENGTRRYVLDADSAARYGIAATVMPHGDSIAPDASRVDSSLADDPGELHRGSVDIVATGPIEAVSNVSVRSDRAFVGTEVDEGGAIELEVGGFEDGNGNAVTNTDEAVAVRLGEGTASAVTPTPGGGSVAVEADPTEIDTDAVDIGTDAEIEIALEDGSQRQSTDLGVVHRAIERADGTWQAGSLPQPASIHVDAEGPRDLVQWNPETGSYEGVVPDGSGDTLEGHRVEHEDLHRGFYAYAADGPIRIGFEYSTTAEESIGTEAVELDGGWHLASSNYDVSGYPERGLEADVNWVEYGFGSDDDAFAVWNVDRTDRIHDSTDGVDIDGSSTPVDHDAVYWIEVDDTDGVSLARGIVSPTFSEKDGVEE